MGREIQGRQSLQFGAWRACVNVALAFPSHYPLGPLAVEFYDNGRKMVTTRRFRFLDPDYEVDVLIEEFFTTDLNSSPRLFWWFFSKHDYPEAGAVHDHLFRTPPVGWTRETCDWVHYRILELGGMPGWKREIVFQLLSKGSKGAWDRYRAMDRGTLNDGASP
jgi:hypothetical protein